MITVPTAMIQQKQCAYGLGARQMDLNIVRHFFKEVGGN